MGFWYLARDPFAGEALLWSTGQTRLEERDRNLPPALMFVGSINADLRSILSAVERILAAQGLTDLHGNDVSLYSCAVGCLEGVCN